MGPTLAAIVLSLTAMQTATDEILRTPRFAFTQAETDRLITLLREPAADAPRSVLRPEEQRQRLTAMSDILATMRGQGRRPLTFVPSWWDVLKGRQSFAVPERRKGHIVSRPFSGYHLSIPSTYDPTRPCPLVICLHSAREPNGLAYLETYWNTTALRETAILFAPDWPHATPPRWSRRDRLPLTLGVLGDTVFQEFNVDRNRVFLDGAGEGAIDTWQLGSSFAHLFAGLILRTASPTRHDSDSPDETKRFTFGNLKNTGVLLFKSPGDEPDFTFDRHHATHELVADELVENTRACRIVELDAVQGDGDERAAPSAKRMARAVVDFLKDTVRDPYPPFVIWTVNDSNARRAYWIESLNEETIWDDPEQPNFQAFLNPQKNRIDIRSHRIRGFEIRLNDSLLDLGRPVSIVVNGSTVFLGQPARSLARLLRSVERSGDWTDVFPWVVRIEVPTQ